MDELHPRLLAVLGRLDADRFVSGEAIARALDCSRAAVHGLIRQAAAFGVHVQSVRGRGYRLSRPLELLDEAWLAGELAPLGLNVLCLPEVDSTNAHLLHLAQTDAPHGTLLAAEWQTAGRGRRGRHWLSPLGAGLTFSLLWRFRRPLAQLSGLSLAVGVALARAMRALGARGIGLKWPNDVLLGEGKLAGILIELSGDMLGPAAAVIGVGVNVRGGEQLTGQVGIPVADLETACGRRLDRNQVLIALMQALVPALTEFDHAGFASMREAWMDLHAWQDRQVAVLQVDGRLLTGRAAGVDDAGALLLDTGAGVLPILAGEVSLRRLGE